MTAYAMKGDKEKFLAAGMNDYISKPIDKEAFLKVIERVMAKAVGANKPNPQAPAQAVPVGITETQRVS